MNTKKTKEELKAEALELAAKLDEMNSRMAEIEKAEREEQEKVERIKREKEQEQKRIDHIEIYAGVAADLVRLLKAVGFADAMVVPAEKHKEDYPVIRVTKENEWDYGVKFETVWTSDVWRPHAKGVRLVVGDYGHKAMYPQRVNGTFNLDKLVTNVKERYEARKREMKRDQEQASYTKHNKDLCVRLMKRFSTLESYGWRKADPNNPDHYESLTGMRVHPSQYTVDRVKLTVDWHPELTEDEAAEMMAFIIKFQKKVNKRYEDQKKGGE